MPKRTRAQAGFRNKRRRPIKRARRTYPRSMVPAASRGYQFNRTERKVNDIVATTYNVGNATAGVVLLCAPQLGTDMTMRIGRKIFLKTVNIVGNVTTQAAITGATASIAVEPNLARISIVLDTQPNGVLANVGDIFTATSSVSHINLNNRDRFKVLKTKRYALGPWYINNVATTSFAMTTQQNYVVKLFKKINVETVFNAGNTGAIGDISTGALLMVVQGSGPAGELVTFNVTTRVRFDDK